MPKINTYLSFDGKAAEAMRHYEKVLGAKLDSLMRVGDMPDAARMPGVSLDRILHGRSPLPMAVSSWRAIAWAVAPMRA